MIPQIFDPPEPGDMVLEDPVDTAEPVNTSDTLDELPAEDDETVVRMLDELEDKLDEVEMYVADMAVRFVSDVPLDPEEIRLTETGDSTRETPGAIPAQPNPTPVVAGFDSLGIWHDDNSGRFAKRGWSSAKAAVIKGLRALAGEAQQEGSVEAIAKRAYPNLGVNRGDRVRLHWADPRNAVLQAVGADGRARSVYVDWDDFQGYQSTKQRSGIDILTPSVDGLVTQDMGLRPMPDRLEGIGLSDAKRERLNDSQALFSAGREVRNWQEPADGSPVLVGVGLDRFELNPVTVPGGPDRWVLEHNGEQVDSVPAGSFDDVKNKLIMELENRARSVLATRLNSYKYTKRGSGGSLDVHTAEGDYLGFVQEDGPNKWHNPRMGIGKGSLASVADQMHRRWLTQNTPVIQELPVMERIRAQVGLPPSPVVTPPAGYDRDMRPTPEAPRQRSQRGREVMAEVEAMRARGERLPPLRDAPDALTARQIADSVPDVPIVQDMARPTVKVDTRSLISDEDLRKIATDPNIRFVTGTDTSGNLRQGFGPSTDYVGIAGPGPFPDGIEANLVYTPSGEFMLADKDGNVPDRAGAWDDLRRRVAELGLDFRTRFGVRPYPDPPTTQDMAGPFQVRTSVDDYDESLPADQSVLANNMRAVPNAAAFIGMVNSAIRGLDENATDAFDDKGQYKWNKISPSVAKGKADSARKALEVLTQNLAGTEPMSGRHRDIEESMALTVKWANSITGDRDRNWAQRIAELASGSLILPRDDEQKWYVRTDLPVDERRELQRSYNIRIAGDPDTPITQDMAGPSARRWTADSIRANVNVYNQGMVPENEIRGGYPIIDVSFEQDAGSGRSMKMIATPGLQVTGGGFIAADEPDVWKGKVPKYGAEKHAEWWGKKHSDGLSLLIRDADPMSTREPRLVDLKPTAADLTRGGVPTVITRDDLMDKVNSYHPSRATTVAMDTPSGNTAHLDVVYTDGKGTGYAKSRNTDMLYRFQQTGTAVRQNQVRVQVTPAEDTGDLAGTLSFDGPSQAGRINVGIAAKPETPVVQNLVATLAAWPAPNNKGQYPTVDTLTPDMVLWDTVPDPEMGAGHKMTATGVVAQHRVDGSGAFNEIRATIYTDPDGYSNWFVDGANPEDWAGPIDGYADLVDGVDPDEWFGWEENGQARTLEQAKTDAFDAMNRVVDQLTTKPVNTTHSVSLMAVAVADRNRRAPRRKTMAIDDWKRTGPVEMTGWDDTEEPVVQDMVVRTPADKYVPGEYKGYQEWLGDRAKDRERLFAEMPTSDLILIAAADNHDLTVNRGTPSTGIPQSVNPNTGAEVIMSPRDAMADLAVERYLATAELRSRGAVPDAEGFDRWGWPNGAGVVVVNPSKVDTPVVQNLVDTSGNDLTEVLSPGNLPNLTSDQLGVGYTQARVGVVRGDSDAQQVIDAIETEATRRGYVVHQSTTGDWMVGPPSHFTPSSPAAPQTPLPAPKRVDMPADVADLAKRPGPLQNLTPRQLGSLYTILNADRALGNRDDYSEERFSNLRREIEFERGGTLTETTTPEVWTVDVPNNQDAGLTELDVRLATVQAEMLSTYADKIERDAPQAPSTVEGDSWRADAAKIREHAARQLAEAEVALPDTPSATTVADIDVSAWGSWKSNVPDTVLNAKIAHGAIVIRGTQAVPVFDAKSIADAVHRSELDTAKRAGDRNFWEADSRMKSRKGVGSTRVVVLDAKSAKRWKAQVEGIQTDIAAFKSQRAEIMAARKAERAARKNRLPDGNDSIPMPPSERARVAVDQVAWVVAKDNYLSRVGVKAGQAVQVKYVDEKTGTISVLDGSTVRDQTVKWERFTPDAPDGAVKVETPEASGNTAVADKAAAATTVAGRVRESGTTGAPVEVADSYLKRYGVNPGDVIVVNALDDKNAVFNHDGRQIKAGWARFTNRVPEPDGDGWSIADPDEGIPDTPVTQDMAEPGVAGTILDQIGMMTVMAISGGKRTPITKDGETVGVRMPAGAGYRVDVTLDADDTYTVNRVLSRKGNDVVKGTVSGVYADMVSDVAYRASIWREPYGVPSIPTGETMNLLVNGDLSAREYEAVTRGAAAFTANGWTATSDAGVFNRNGVTVRRVRQDTNGRMVWEATDTRGAGDPYVADVVSKRGATPDEIVDFVDEITERLSVTPVDTANLIDDATLAAYIADPDVEITGTPYLFDSKQPYGVIARTPDGRVNHVIGRSATPSEARGILKDVQRRVSTLATSDSGADLIDTATRKQATFRTPLEVKASAVQVGDWVDMIDGDTDFPDGGARVTKVDNAGLATITTTDGTFIIAGDTPVGVSRPTAATDDVPEAPTVQGFRPSHLVSLAPHHFKMDAPKKQSMVDEAVSIIASGVWPGPGSAPSRTELEAMTPSELRRIVERLNRWLASHPYGDESGVDLLSPMVASQDTPLRENGES